MLVAVSSWFSISSLEGAAGAAAGCGGPEPINTFRSVKSRCTVCVFLLLEMT